MKKCVELNKNWFDSAWIFGVFSVGLSILSVATFSILTTNLASADDTVVDLINITVPIACSVTSPTTDQTYTASMMNNEYKNNLGSTTFVVTCNDTAGFAIYAIGYGGSTLGVTDMISSAGANYNIATGTATSGDTSNWAMKLTPVSGDDAPTIVNGFNNFHAVPSAWTRVAQFTHAVESSVGSSFTSTYAVWISGVQAAGTYTGKVRYHLIHPNTSCMSYTVHFNAGTGSGTMSDQVICSGVPTNLTTNGFTPPSSGYQFLEWNTEPNGTGESYSNGESVTDIADVDSTINLYAMWYRPPTNLYNEIAGMTKGTQSRTDLQTTISTSNSGVYTYNSSVFGADTDGTKSDNTKANIYYYRGILDSSFTSSTYGSSGNGALWPNYVILSTSGTKSTSDTCWRIIRTTGSGGVKMIYNGKWTGSTCANAQNNARTGASYYNSTSATNARAIANAGYTFNSYGTSTSTTNGTAPDTLFGSNSSYSGNSNNSTIKGNVETWYSSNNSNLSSYTSILEPNAGFCNDRLVRSSQNSTSVPSTLRPVGNTSGTGTNAYFAGNQRNLYNSTTMIPSLGCSRVGSTNPARSTVDVYSTSTASGGNGQLSQPIALITADELSFAGAGSSTANQGSTYSQSVYVRSGNSFWTMTPSYRSTSNSRATMMIYSNSGGYLSSASMYTSYDVRPVISLKEGTVAIDGTGTAADPWVVTAP